MSLEERDDAFRRKIGWPSTQEQKAYWESKETQNQINEHVLELIKGMQRTVGHLMDAVNGLRDICEHHQSVIEQLTKKETKCQ